MKVTGTPSPSYDFTRTSAQILNGLGLTVDTTKLLIGANGNAIVHVGNAVIRDTSAAVFAAMGVFYQKNTSSFSIGGAGAGSNVSNITASSPMAFANGDNVSFNVRLPIVGWGGTNTVSSEDNASPIVASIYGAPASATAGNPIIFPTVYRNDLGAYNATTGLFTAPVSDWYEVTAFSVASINGGNNVYASVNGNTTPGANRPKLTQIKTTGDVWSGSAIVYALAGQTISVRSSASSGAGDAGDSLTIRRMQNRQQIAASENISFKCGTYSNGAIASTMKLYTGTNVWDTHGAFNASTGIFTAPASGEYEFSAQISGNYSVGGMTTYFQCRDVATLSKYAFYMQNGLTNNSQGYHPNGRIKLLTGEQVRFEIESVGGTFTPATGANATYFAGRRVGNY